MNTSEKTRIHFCAMQKAKVFETSKFKLLVVFFSLLSINAAILGWIKTGLITTSLLAIMLVFIVSLITIYLLFRPHYRSFLDDTIKNKHLVLGNEEQRIANNKKREKQLTILAFFLPVGIFAIFVLL